MSQEIVVNFSCDHCKDFKCLALTLDRLPSGWSPMTGRRGEKWEVCSNSCREALGQKTDAAHTAAEAVYKKLMAE